MWLVPWPCSPTAPWLACSDTSCAPGGWCGRAVGVTEREWEAGTDPDEMLRFLCGRKGQQGLLAWLGFSRAPPADLREARASERKLRLLACAYCRRIQGLLPDDERCRNFLDAAEAFVDGLLGDEELQKAEAIASQGLEAVRGRSLNLASGVSLKETLTGARIPSLATQAAFQAARGSPEMACVAAVQAVIEVGMGSSEAARWAAGALGAAVRTHILHCVCGNPFRPFIPDPAWLAWNDGTVVKLTRVIYDERDLPSGNLDAARLEILADALEEAGCSDQAVLGHLRGPGPHARGCWPLDCILGQS